MQENDYMPQSVSGCINNTNNPSNSTQWNRNISRKTHNFDKKILNVMPVNLKTSPLACISVSDPIILVPSEPIIGISTDIGTTSVFTNDVSPNFDTQEMYEINRSYESNADSNNYISKDVEPILNDDTLSSEISKENIIHEGYTPMSLGDVNSTISEYTKYFYSSSKIALFSPFQFIHDLEMKFASEIASLFVEHSTYNDRTIIYNQINSFVIISTSFFIVYNWYFVQFYKDGLHRIKTPEISIASVFNISWITGFLFKWNVVPVSILNNVLIDTVPKYMSDMLSKKMTMIVLFITIVIAVQTFGEMIYSSFVSALHFKIDHIGGIYIGIMAIYGIIDVINPATDGLLEDVVEAGKSYLLRANPILGIAYYTYMLISYIIRLIWSTLTVFVSSLTVTMYLMFMSLFSMAFLSSETVNVFHTIRMINYYIETDINGKNDSTNIPACGDSIFSKILIFLNTKSKRALFYV